MREYGMELGSKDVTGLIKRLKEKPFSNLVFRLRHPYNIFLNI